MPVVLPALIALAACTPASQAEDAGSPSESVNCGTVVSSLADLKSAYAQLDSEISSGTSAGDLVPLGGTINSLTFDITNQLQGASKESLTAVANGAQSVVDTLAKQAGSNTSGDALAQEIASAQPANLDSSIEDLSTFAQEACGGS